MKIRRIGFFSALVVTICVVGGGEMNAATIFVANPSFESPGLAEFNTSNATGWVGNNYNPTNAQYGGTTGGGTPPGGDGSQLGYLSGGIGFISQVLLGVDGTLGTADDPLVTANTNYSLSVAIGAGLDVPYSGYSIELGAYNPTSGYTPFGIQTNTITPSAGQLLDTTLLVDTTGISPSLIGQNLTIVLRNTTPTFSRTDFDNVRLNATAVPEPSSVMLWGAGAFVLGIFRLRRIDRNALSALALLSICATTVQAATVFQDNFNRSGPLHGSTPSLTPGGNWTAQSGFATDGTKVNAGPAFLQSAYVPMPVAITSGNIYTLSATMFRGLSGDNSAIMMFGFFDAAPSWNATVSVDEGHAIAIAPRNNQAQVTSILNGTLGANISVADGTNGVIYGVRLYETAPNTWSAVAVELAPTNQVISFAPTPISLTNIFTIGMISGSTQPPYIDNLTLDVTPVPEPGTVSLLAVGAVGVVGWLMLKRRSRHA